MKHRHEAEHNRHQQRNRKGEEKNVRAHADLADAGQIAVIKTDDQTHTPRCEQGADRSGDERQDQRFHDELPGQSCARRAQRRAQGNFFPSRRRAHEQKIRDIRAGDREQQSDCTAQNKQYAADVAHGTLAERKQTETGGIRLRTVFQFQRATNRCDFGARLLKGNARAQTSDDPKIVRGPRLVRRINCTRIPNVSARRKFRQWRQDANDGETAIRKTERGSFQICPALQYAFPKAVADHGDLISFAQRFGGNQTTQGRRNSKHAKKISGNPTNVRPHRLISTCDRVRTEEVTGNRLEAAIARGEIVKIRLRDPHAAAGFVQFCDLDETFLRWIWQRAQEDRIHHAKNRGGRAHSEREGYDRDQTEARPFPERTAREPDLSEEIIHNGARPSDRLSWPGAPG